MKTLDRARPYGQICGGAVHGARYEQDNMLFNEDGKLIEEPELPKAASTEPESKAKPAKKAPHA